MSDRLVVAAAALAAVLALVAPAVPVVAAVVAVLVAAVLRRPGPLAVAVALMCGARAHAAVAALERPLPVRMAGTAELVGDPEPGRFGTRVPVRLAGRRWSAEVPLADEAVVRDLLTGDHLAVRGRPRPFRDVPVGWIRSRHLAGRLIVEEVDRGPPAAPWYRLANGVHRTLDAGAASFDEEGRALYLGLVIGDDRMQSDLTRYRFRASGLSHLLAVSGQNVAFLLAVCRPVLDRCGLRARWWLGLFALGLFVLVTRAEPSVLRAAAMAGIALWAAVAGRPVSGARIVSLAVLGLLLVDPLLVHSTGFRLSVAATVGLLVLARPLAARLPGPRWLAEPLAVTLAAQAATAPVLLTFTDGVPPVATVANLLAVGPAGAVMMLGIGVGLPAGLLRPEVAAVLQVPNRLLVAWVGRVATAASRVPIEPLGLGSLPLLVAVAVALVVATRWSHATARRWPVRVAVTVGSAAVLVSVLPPRPAPGLHRVAGATAAVWPCGPVTVEVRDGSLDDVLVALRSVGVDSADRVDGGDGWLVAPVAEQLGAATGPAGVPCSVPP